MNNFAFYKYRKVLNMLKRISLLVLCFVAVLTVSFTDPDKRVRALISTSLGDIQIVLYDETPLHRDNFLKLIRNGTLDSTLFHRVIRNFMIQGGDIDSKKAMPGAVLGNGTLGYTIPAEFHPMLFHKKGALAAARMSDEVNPKQESSPCQFYIVQGMVYTDSTLNQFIQSKDMPVKQRLFSTYINAPENAALLQAFIRAQQRAQLQNNPDSLTYLSSKIEPTINAQFEKMPHRTITPEQRKIYTTIGGTPHLDGAYTVFGEVEKGLDIVDKIAVVPVDQNSRPNTDIRILKVKLYRQ
jgi:peptidylprolyl isomerase